MPLADRTVLSLGVGRSQWCDQAGTDPGAGNGAYGADASTVIPGASGLVAAALQAAAVCKTFKHQGVCEQWLKTASEQCMRRCRRQDTRVAHSIRQGARFANLHYKLSSG